MAINHIEDTSEYILDELQTITNEYNSIVNPNINEQEYMYRMHIMCCGMIGIIRDEHIKDGDIVHESISFINSLMTNIIDYANKLKQTTNNDKYMTRINNINSHFRQCVDSIIHT